jgi:ribonuclease HIII
LDTKEKTALSIINRYRSLLQKNNLQVTELSRNEFSYQVIISDEREKISLLVFFGKKGNKVVIQGNKDLRLHKKVYDLIYGEKLFETNASKDEPAYPYIGTDESGKGDYFGPIVFAGVFVTQETGKILKSIGVRDSKDISDGMIKQLSKEIKLILKSNFDLVHISPEKYNQLWGRMGNLNLIMGWGHAKVIENLLNKCNAQEAISDKFGNEKIILNALQEKGRNINLQQITKAERFSAVAAASILARESVINWFNVNSRKYEIELPKGSSSNNVEHTAKIIFEKHGTETLNKLVKMHFKTSQKVFNQ